MSDAISYRLENQNIINFYNSTSSNLKLQYMRAINQTDLDLINKNSDGKLGISGLTNNIKNNGTNISGSVIGN